MKLTQEQADQILNKLNACKDKRKSCSICGENKWVINDTIFEIREFNMGNLIVEGADYRIMPLISISCENCGYTKFLNAIKLGIISTTDDKKK